MGLALCAALLVAGPVAAEESKKEATKAVKAQATKEVKVQTAPSPVRLNRDKIAGIDLPAGELFVPPELILEGHHRPRGEMLYQGKELTLEIYEDGPATYAAGGPFPVDEFVLVMSGKLILTDAGGRVQEFVAGDSLVVPKGWVGTWKMVGNYRELIAIVTSAYEEADAADEADAAEKE
jgi:uncharacterized cupin superfamily protein